MCKKITNDSISERGKKTRFGDGNDPVAARAKSEPWGIKRAIRKLLASKYEADKPVTFKQAAKRFGDTPTGIELLVAQRFVMAVQGDMNSMRWIERKIGE